MSSCQHFSKLATLAHPLTQCDILYIWVKIYLYICKTKQTGWTYPIILHFQGSVPLWQFMGPDAPIVIHHICHPLLSNLAARWVSSNTGVRIRLDHRFPAHQHDQEEYWCARKEQPPPTTPGLILKGSVILYGWTGALLRPRNGDKAFFPDIPL